MTRSTLVLALVCLGCLAAPSAHAVQVTIEFGGGVTFASEGNLPAPPSEGERFTGRFRFETSLVEPREDEFGRFFYVPMLAANELSVGGLELHAASGFRPSNQAPDGAGCPLGCSDFVATLHASQWINFIVLHSDDGPQFSDADVFQFPASLSGWDSATLTVSELRIGSLPLRIEGTIDSWTVTVPEPSAALALLGLGALLVRRTR